MGGSGEFERPGVREFAESRPDFFRGDTAEVEYLLAGLAVSIERGWKAREGKDLVYTFAS